MNIIPITFAFDNNLVMPACICLSSLMMNSKSDTFYDIFILHSEHEELQHEELDKLPSYYPNCRINYRKVGPVFDCAFEIRGITTPAYYRLLIPELIPEYDKVIYSDVDVIFREDLSNFYHIDIGDSYIAGVNSLAHLDKDTDDYYHKIKLPSKGIIYSGNIIFNSKQMRKDDIVGKFIHEAKNDYKFQDMDVINIICQNRIIYLLPSFCFTNYINKFAIENPSALFEFWTDEQIEDAKNRGIVHYNGQKPWRGYCVNFDIWWEYYRKSPFFDERYYYKFFNEKLDEYDRLPILKRIKILARYFIIGRKN